LNFANIGLMFANCLLFMYLPLHQQKNKNKHYDK